MTERALSDREVLDICDRYGIDEDVDMARTIEQAVLHSDEVQALRKDAERYRWVKQNVQEGFDLPGGYYLSDEDTDTWDRTIDAAMEQQP